MKINKLTKLTTINSSKSPVKNYRSNPGDFELAAIAAVYYAKKFHEDVVIVPGNSYGRKIYHVVRLNEDLDKYQPGVRKSIVGVAQPNGDVYRALASN